MWTRLIGTAMLLLAALPTWATTYYVATTGSDSSVAPTNPATPFRSIQKGVTTAACGDTVTVANGTYLATDGNGSGATSIAVYIRSDANPVLDSVNCTAANPVTVKSTNPLGAKVMIPSITNTGNRAFRLSRAGWVIEGFEITGGTQPGGTQTNLAFSGVYLTTGANNVTVQKNWFHHIANTVCSTSAYGFVGVFLENNVSNVVAKNNLFHTIGRLRDGESGCASGDVDPNGDHAFYIKASTDNLLIQNVCYDVTRGFCFHYYGGTNVRPKAYHNTTSGKAPGEPSGQWRLHSTMSDGEFKNNISHDCRNFCFSVSPFTAPTNVVITENMSDHADADMCGSTIPAGVSCAGNTASATLGFANAASNNYTLTASSQAINAGTTSVGLPFNGSAPDIGAYESFGFSSAGIAANTLDVQLGMNLNIPVQPTVAGWSVGCTGTGCGTRTVTAAVKKSGTDSIVSLTIDGAVCTTAQTWTVTYSQTTGVTVDSALIGGTLNQELSSFTAQPVVNNCSGPVSNGTFNQVAHQFYQSRYATGTTDPVALGTLSGSVTVPTGQSFAVVTQTDCTVGDCDPIGQRLYYSRQGGAFLPVPDTCSTDFVCFFGNTADPEVLTGTVTCCVNAGLATKLDGSTQHTASAVPIYDLPQNGSTVHRRVLKLGSGAIIGQTYDFKEYNQNGTVFTTYTPSGGARVTVGAGISAPTDLDLTRATSGANMALLWPSVTSTNFAGYHVYQSTTPGTYQGWTKEITFPSAVAAYQPPTQATLQAPGATTYYFVVKSFDQDGNESAATTEVSATAPLLMGRPTATTRTVRTP